MKLKKNIEMGDALQVFTWRGRYQEPYFGGKLGQHCT
jgi:hypothetical protein